MWRWRRGNLRVRRYTTIFVSTSLCAGVSATVVLATIAMCAADSEERALRQALTIVQLLRAEYGRLADSSTEAPAATCAPTTAVLPSQSIPSPSRRYWTAWKVQASPGRRMDYDDGFGEHPEDTPKPSSHTSPDTPITSSPSHSSTSDPERPITTSQKVTTTPMSDAPSATTKPSSASPTPAISTPSFTKLKPLGTSTPTSKPSSRITVSLTTASKATEPPPKTMKVPIVSLAKPVSPSPLVSLQSVMNSQPTTHTKSEALKTQKKLRRSTKKHEVTDTPLELQQAAMEFANELKTQDARGRRPRRPTTGAKLRASWHEHLSRSTRYPVPLPENHAFCYTDPGNALCRTLI